MNVCHRVLRKQVSAGYCDGVIDCENNGSICKYKYEILLQKFSNKNNFINVYYIPRNKILLGLQFCPRTMD